MRSMAIIAVSILLLSSTQVLSAPAGKPLPVGSTETVLALRPLIDLPEGIAIDNRGHIFVGNRRLENDTRVSEILEIALDGTVTVFATLDPAVVDDIGTGVLGLAFDSQGDLYAALASFNPRTHGVWRIRQRGEAERLRGSKQMIQPNAITFDNRRNIYVTDSADGTVWRFTGTEPGKLWIRHEFLAPDPNFGIGANGITFIPPRDLFVANTDLGLIAKVEIKQDGSPGKPEVVAAGIELLTVDGLAADAQGQLHAVIAAAPAFGTDSLVHVNPVTGEIKSSTARADAFDFPTSLAFGRGPRDHDSVYLVNAGLYPEGRPDAAPGVIRVAVGVPGVRTDATQSAVVEGPGQVGFGPLHAFQFNEGSVIDVFVSRTGGSQGAVSVNYSTTGSTATAGEDFVAAPGTINWADGDMESKAIRVEILRDGVAEDNEDLEIGLSSPTGGATISQSTFQLQITANGASSGGGATGGGAGGGGSLDWLVVLFLTCLALVHRWPVQASAIQSR